MKDRKPTPMTLKGLQDMRTTAAAVSGKGPGVAPHKLHMRLCALEMERFRRDQERRVALERAAKCEARCRALEAEVHQLMEVIRRGSAEAEPPVVSTRPPRAGELPPGVTHLY